MSIVGKSYKGEEEEIVSASIGYPYNILPKGYPSKISDDRINVVIDKVMNNLINNAGVETIVNRDYALISIGLNELNNRTSRRQSRMAFWFSLVSLIISALSFMLQFKD